MESGFIAVTHTKIQVAAYWFGENKVVGKVINSKITYTKLYNILKEVLDNNEDVTITIE